MFAAGVSEVEGVTRPVVAALDVLRRLHLGRNRRATADTVAQLLDATRAHAGVAIWPTGEQALANLLRVVDQARRFEAAGATSFRAFVQWLDEESERGNAAEAPVVEEGTDGVRIMTVYKAKGLEFPVVILVDPTCPHTFQEPSRYVDGKKRLWAMPLAGCTPIELIEHRDEILRHDNDEAVRLTYVAATRARELLVVPGVGDEPYAGWVDVLHPALYPGPVDWRRSQPAPGCPPFGGDTVLDRPDGRDPEGSVTPGLHAPSVGTHTVVFWDPRALELGKDEEAGLRQQRILAADETGAVAEEGSRAHGEWLARRTNLLARGAIPTFRVETVTEGAGPGGPPIGVVVEESDAVGTPRPGGKRFGTLVHAVLASIALDAGDAQVKAAAGTYGQMLGANPAEVASASHAVSAALRHPVMKAAHAAGAACRREAPVLLPRDDGALVEGALDLAYRVTEPSGPVWVIVDYKTDAELSGRRAEYEEQVRTYARAVARATGEATRGVLLRV
jgi:ATP-dependent exoDNAse (exonuclease V) beta subunit